MFNNFRIWIGKNRLGHLMMYLAPGPLSKCAQPPTRGHCCSILNEYDSGSEYELGTLGLGPFCNEQLQTSYTNLIDSFIYPVVVYTRSCRHFDAKNLYVLVYSVCSQYKNKLYKYKWTVVATARLTTS